jgi:hypothetical protein
MTGLAGTDNFIWGLNALTRTALFFLLLVRKDYKEFPAFFSYISADSLQSFILFVSYRKFGYASTSIISFRIAWGTQAVVLTVRALAVAEICRHLLGRYRGIWELAWRILFAIAGAVLLYASITARHEWFMFTPNLARSIELAIATGIVCLFLFARHYEIVPEPLISSLALGFLLISCLAVLNSTVLERFVHSYEVQWTVLNMLAFFASLLVWTWAFLQPRTAPVKGQTLFTDDLYKTIGPEVNVRLRQLNEQLSRFWKVDGDQN